MEEHQSYWVERLSGGRGASGLAPDYERPALHHAAKAEVEVSLPPGLQKGLAGLTGDSPFLLYTALMAALKVCLHKYSGAAEVVVGSPARRKQGGAPAAAVAVLDAVNDADTFRELLLRVRATLLEAYAAQDYDLPRLLGELGLEEVGNRCPLFDVALVLEDIHEPLPDLRQDVTVRFAGGAGGLEGRAEYNPALFDAASVRRFADHFARALEQGVADPGAAVGRIALLSAEESRRQLVEWNRTAADYPADKCVHHLFEEQARRTPDAVALTHADESLSYGELKARANRLARHLRGLGVGPGVLVGLSMERSAEMIVSLLAVLKAGGAYVPLDPTYPPERLSFMLEDARVPVLLTQSGLWPRPPAGRLRVVCLDAEAESIAAYGADDLRGGATPDDLAYVIYTSGSTGRPKGVMIRHRGVCNMRSAQAAAFEVRPGSRVVQFASLSFDASVYEIVMTLCTGATLCLIDRDTALPGAGLIEWLRRERISVATLPPSVLLASPADELPELKTLVVAGEACPAEVAERWAHGRTVLNAYGPTETTVWATVSEPLGAGRKPDIGRPIANTQVYVLDRSTRPVPVGVAGEIYVGGAGLARGYLGRPALTAEKFIPDPFSAEPGARLYRTGDLARYLPDGRVEYLNRADHQVKLRGYRVELGEVEAALEGHAAVRQSVVMAREDAPGDQRLVAYFVPNGGAAPAPGELADFLREKLPAYMVPGAYVVLEALPLTPNGKVNRAALPAPGAERPALAARFAAPRTPVEEVIAGIWARVLGLEEVGVNDNFHEIGGHSLLATRVLSRVREAFEVDLPIKTLFEAVTVSALAERVEQATAAGRSPAPPPVTRVAREGDLPLSLGQQRLWFAHQLDPDTSLYNIPVALHMTGRLDVPALERCLAEITARHEALRTTFKSVAGRPAQVISPPRPVSIPVVEVAGADDDARRREARRLAVEEGRKPFDLERGPLMRAKVLRLGGESHAVLFTMHHIVSDGWSLGILVNEVAALYRAGAGGAPADLPELRVQYADYAAWQRERLRGAYAEGLLDYWRGQLEGAQLSLRLPWSRPRPQSPTFRGVNQPVRLAAGLTASLKELSRAEGVTLYMTLLAAFKTLLYRYSGQEEIVVGSPIANRPRPEVEGLIGYFVNVLALRTDLSGNPTFRGLLARVRKVALGAYAHQDLPVEKLLGELQPERGAGGAGPFPLVFVLQNAPAGELELPGVTLDSIEFPKTTTQSDLYLALTETSEGMQGALKYSVDLFEAGAVERLARGYENLLAEVAASPDLRLLDIPFEQEAAAESYAAPPAAYRTDQFLF